MSIVRKEAFWPYERASLTLYIRQVVKSIDDYNGIALNC
jgi:hypothetical protein